MKESLNTANRAAQPADLTGLISARRMRRDLQEQEGPRASCFCSIVFVSLV